MLSEAMEAVGGFVKMVSSAAFFSDVSFVSGMSFKIFFGSGILTFSFISILDGL